MRTKIEYKLKLSNKKILFLWKMLITRLSNNDSIIIWINSKEKKKKNKLRFNYLIGRECHNK